MGVYFSESPSRGGGKLRIRMRKVKDLVNNASILAIFLLKGTVLFRLGSHTGSF